MPEINVKTNLIIVLILGVYKISNSEATGPGICTVHVPTISLVGPKAGYYNASSRYVYSRSEACCVGWRQKPYSYRLECEPVCEGGCVNGTCIAPNKCICRYGYTKDHNNNCIPTCPFACPHGVCFGGRCQCMTGYMISSDGKYCKPICNGGCGMGGECISPNACRCKPGYQLNRQTNKCQFHCFQDCGKGGFCSGPHRCSCLSGYKLVKNQCQPICPRGCRNGFCNKPNVCSCPVGSILNRDQDGCVPHCPRACLNGICIAYDTCQCKSGYVQDPKNRHRCLPFCPQGCKNGICTAPNFCVCSNGLVKHPNNKNECVSKTIAILHTISNTVRH